MILIKRYLKTKKNKNKMKAIPLFLFAFLVLIMVVIKDYQGAFGTSVNISDTTSVTNTINTPDTAVASDTFNVRDTEISIKIVVLISGIISIILMVLTNVAIKLELDFDDCLYMLLIIFNLGTSLIFSGTFGVILLENLGFTACIAFIPAFIPTIAMVVILFNSIDHPDEATITYKVSSVIFYIFMVINSILFFMYC